MFKGSLGVRMKESKKPVLSKEGGGGVGIKCNGLLDSVNIRMTLLQLLLHNALCIKLVFFFFFFACLFSFQSQVFPITVVTKKNWSPLRSKEMADIAKELNHGSSGCLDTTSFA